MIKATELRIGNYFYYECETLHMTTLAKVVAITKDGVYTGGEMTGQDIYIIGLINQWGNSVTEHVIDLEPIPLSEELLKKCGFKNKIHPTQDGQCRFWDINFGFTLEQYLKSGEIFQYCGEDYVRINYAHQFQNLYYALMGKELELSHFTAQKGQIKAEPKQKTT